MKMANALLGLQVFTLKSPCLALMNRTSILHLQYFCKFHTPHRIRHKLKLRKKQHNFLGSSQCSNNLVSNRLEGRYTYPIRLKGTLWNQMQEVTMATTLEEILEVVGKSGTVPDISDVCSTFAKLQAMVELTHDDDRRLEIVQLLTEKGEFYGFCSHAANQVNNMCNDELCDTMQVVSGFHSNESSPFPPSLICELYSEGHRRVHTFNIQQLSKFSNFFVKTIKCRCYGAISSRFSELFETLSTKDFHELIALMQASVYTSTSDFHHKVLKKATAVLTASANDNMIVTGSDIVEILKYQRKSHIQTEFHALNDLCCQLVCDQITTISTDDLLIAHNILMRLKHVNGAFRRAVYAEVSKRLLEPQKAKDLGKILELISLSPVDLRASLKPLIGEKIKDLLVNYTDAPIGSICFASKRVGYLFSSSLLDILVKRMKHTEELLLTDMINIAQYLAILQTSPPLLKAWKFLNFKLNELKSCAYSPHFIINILRCQLLRPIDNLAISDLDISTLEDILPQLSVYYINHLSLQLQALKFRLSKSSRGTDASHIKQLLKKVNYHATENVQEILSPAFLFNLFHHTLKEDAENSVSLQKIATRYRYALSENRSRNNALRCVKLLYKEKYLDVALLDTIADILTDDIKDMDLDHLTLATVIFRLLGFHDTPNIDHFLQACIDRVSYFLDHLHDRHIFNLLTIAVNLSCAQRFPEPLIKKIFSVEFLEKFDAVQSRHRISQEQNQHMMNLMNLNRTVVLECPELQIPWFQEKFWQNKLQQGITDPSMSVIPELQDTLVEVLGGDQYFRTLVLAPYYIKILFEFVLDGEGYPLPIAEYGSVLNRPGLPEESKTAGNQIQWNVYTEKIPDKAQRVAIDFMRKGQYYTNSKSLLSSPLIKRRHLEIMGYKYIQIPYYEWESRPEIADREAYLQNLLFG